MFVVNKPFVYLNRDYYVTPYYYGQFALSLEKESPYIFYEIDPRNAHPVNADNSNAPLLPPQFPY